MLECVCMVQTDLNDINIWYNDNNPHGEFHSLHLTHHITRRSGLPASRAGVLTCLGDGSRAGVLTCLGDGSRAGVLTCMFCGVGENPLNPELSSCKATVLTTVPPSHPLSAPTRRARWWQEVHPSCDQCTSSRHQNITSHSDERLCRCIYNVVHFEYNTSYSWKTGVTFVYKELKELRGYTNTFRLDQKHSYWIFSNTSYIN